MSGRIWMRQLRPFSKWHLTSHSIYPAPSPALSSEICHQMLHLNVTGYPRSYKLCPFIHCTQLANNLSSYQDDRLKELAKTTQKGFEKAEGPFVRGLDAALASFNVARQAYYSGTFIGNHVHQTLKVSK